MHQAFNQQYEYRPHMSPPTYPSQSSRRLSSINQLDLDDEPDPLFGQPMKGSSQPVEGESPIDEVAPVKRKAWVDVSENSKDGNAKKAAGFQTEVQPIGRDKVKKKGSSSASRSSSSDAADSSLVDALLGKFTTVATPLFSSRKESFSEYLRKRKRELEMEDLRRPEQAKLKRLKLAQHENFEQQMLAQKGKELEMQEKNY
ncbi:hypothetical protein Tco_0246782 [Tanacetum coccineum]